MSIPRITSALNYISDDKIMRADKPRKKHSALPLICSLGGTCVAAAVICAVVLNGVVPLVKRGIVITPASGNTSSSSLLYDLVIKPYTPYKGKKFVIDYDNLPLRFDGITHILRFSDSPYEYRESNGPKIVYAHKAEELFGNNPWNESLDITELPVIDGQEMPHETIKVDYSGELPEGCYPECNYDWDTIVKNQTYFAEKYPDILGYENYALKILGSYPDFFTEPFPPDYEQPPFYTVGIDEASDNIFEAMLNYNFNTGYFSAYEGELLFNRQNGLSKFSVAGFYPVLSPEEALETNKTLERFPYEGVTEDNVLENIELVYRRTYDARYYAPYYRCLVDTEDTDELHKFIEYYIPALSPEYLEDSEKRPYLD